MFIPNLANKFFQDVLERYNALGAAVLIHDHGHVMMLFPQCAQQRGNLRGAGCVQRRGNQFVHCGIAAAHRLVIVFFMNNTDDIVDGFVIDRQAGITRLNKGICQFLHRDVVRYRHDVHARGQDLFNLHVIELDCTANQFTFVVGQFAVILGLTDHGHQFGIGNAALLTVEMSGKKFLPSTEQKVQRREQRDKRVQNRCGGCGKGFRHLLGHALRGNLTKNQYNDGDDHGRYRGTGRAAQKRSEVHSAEGGKRDVHDVVADKDGGKQAVIPLRER